MKILAVLVLALSCAASKSAVLTVGTSSWSNCDPADEIQTISFSLSPDPVTVPGQVNISLELLGSLPVESGTPANFTFAYRQNSTQPWGDFGCVNALIPLGSCSYADVCTIFNYFNPPADKCPSQYGNQPCRCPFPANVPYSLNASYQLDTSSGYFPSGDYQMTMVLYEDATYSNQIFCNKISFSLLIQ